jgi:hypothetical protein
MKALVLKIGAFIAFCGSLFMLGRTKAKLIQAEKEKNNAIKANRKANNIKSKPYVDKPFRRMLRKK